MAYPEVTHEDTSRVKESKISVLVYIFELFTMKDGESISEIFSRFADITNSLIGLGKTYTQVEMVRKILLALTSEWEKKVTAIEEANDLSTLSVESLIGNLMAYEVNLQERRKEDSRKKSIAFKAIEATEDSNDENDLNLMTRAFRNFLKNGKFINFKDNVEPLCFKCNKPGHVKKDCPLYKSSKRGKFKRAFEANWEDDSSSSEDEANMCFTAKEVCKTPEYIELLKAFHVVYKNFKEVKKDHKIISRDNDSLHQRNDSMIGEIKSLLLVKDDFDKLKKTHSKLIVENDNLKAKNLSLEKEISEVKVKYEEISLNVKKFNNGKEKLHDLLTFQSNDKNKFGLGFDEKSCKKVSSKTKLEEVFVKTQSSFKVSKNSKKDIVYNKNIFTNYSKHSF